MASQVGGADDANKESKCSDREAEIVVDTDSVWSEFERLLNEDGGYARHTFEDVNRQSKSFVEQRRLEFKIHNDASGLQPHVDGADDCAKACYYNVVPMMGQRGRWDDGSDRDLKNLPDLEPDLEDLPLSDQR